MQWQQRSLQRAVFRLPQSAVGADSELHSRDSWQLTADFATRSFACEQSSQTQWRASSAHFNADIVHWWARSWLYKLANFVVNELAISSSFVKLNVAAQVFAGC